MFAVVHLAKVVVGGGIFNENFSGKLRFRVQNPRAGHGSLAGIIVDRRKNS